MSAEESFSEAFGVSRGDIALWSAEEYRAHVFHENRYLWWGGNIRVGLCVLGVAVMLTAVVWPVFIAVVTGVVMILHGRRQMRAEKALSDHHLNEHLQWEEIKEVW